MNKLMSMRHTYPMSIAESEGKVTVTKGCQIRLYSQHFWTLWFSGIETYNKSLKTKLKVENISFHRMSFWSLRLYIKSHLLWLIPLNFQLSPKNATRSFVSKIILQTGKNSKEGKQVLVYFSFVQSWDMIVDTDN